MARTVSLLVTLALSPVAQAIGIITPLCTCAAEAVEDTCDIAGDCDTINLPNGQCDDLLLPDTVNVPCAGVFTCLPDIGWDFFETGESCDSLSTRSGCEDADGIYLPPLANECCGDCAFP